MESGQRKMKKDLERAVFLDRDGTILKDCHFLSHPDHIQIYKGAIPALKKLSKQGWKLIIGTNQSGIGRGYFDLKVLKKIHDRLLSIFHKNHLSVDDIYFCPHHPDEKCDCRKPNIGMLLKAEKKHKLDLKKCVVVGDKASDIEWGKRAGAKAILVLTGKGKKTRAQCKMKPDHVSPTLTHAVNWILKHGA